MTHTKYHERCTLLWVVRVVFGFPDPKINQFNFMHVPTLMCLWWRGRRHGCVRGPRRVREGGERNSGVGALDLIPWIPSIDDTNTSPQIEVRLRAHNFQFLHSPKQITTTKRKKKIKIRDLIESIYCSRISWKRPHQQELHHWRSGLCEELGVWKLEQHNSGVVRRTIEFSFSQTNKGWLWFCC